VASAVNSSGSRTFLGLANTDAGCEAMIKKIDIARIREHLERSLSFTTPHFAKPPVQLARKQRHFGEAPRNNVGAEREEEYLGCVTGALKVRADAA
jgi:hypothetical protein